MTPADGTTGTEVADTAGMHTDTTNPSRITTPVAGTDAITVKKGTLYLGSSIDAAPPAQHRCDCRRLAAGDYVELLATAADGTGRHISPFEEPTPLGAGRATRRDDPRSGAVRSGALPGCVDSPGMTNSGDRFDFPDGSAYIVRRPSAETGGEYVEMEFVLPSGCVAPPPHVHPHQVEEYEVLDGRVEILVDGTWLALGPGESASVPQGALHTFRNRSGAVARVRNWHRPAMRFEEFIERTSQTMRAAGITRKRDPRVYICLSKVMLQFDDTIVPGRRRERIPMQALARLGDLLRLPA